MQYERPVRPLADGAFSCLLKRDTGKTDKLASGLTDQSKLGPREQVALHVTNTQLAQRIALAGGLDTFGNDTNAQAPSDQHDPGDYGLAYRIMVDATGQHHVQLENVRLESRQQVEP